MKDDVTIHRGSVGTWSGYNLQSIVSTVFFSAPQVGVSELATQWRSFVVLLQRLAATLATSSNHNSMELALLAVRNHVNDAILHAQLHGPRITATVREDDITLRHTHTTMSNKLLNHLHSYTPIIKSFECWTQSWGAVGSFQPAVGSPHKGLVPRWSKNRLTLQRIRGFPQSVWVCVGVCACECEYRSRARQKDPGWRDNRYPECSWVLSDEKVSVANLWTNRRHTNNMHTRLEEETESLSNTGRNTVD